MASLTRDVASAYSEHMRDPRQERAFLGSAAFFATFGVTRTITHAIRSGRGPFRNLTPGGRHIHHMTFGILALLVTGYLWMNEIGVGSGRRRRASRMTAAMFGSGCALTLDEFALWLNLEDDYWTKEGRESIDAVILFGSALLLAGLGRDILREVVSVRRMAPHARRAHRVRRAALHHRRAARELLAEAARPA